MSEDDKLPEGSVEIVSAERVRDMWHTNAPYLIMPDFELHRLNTPNGRVYFIFDDGKPVYFMGVGSLDKELPKDENLEKAMADTGWVSMQRKMHLRMLGGSFLHSRLVDLGTGKKIVLHDIPEMLREYYFNQHFYIMNKEMDSLSREIQKDLIGIAQWIRDYEVEFIALEYPVFSHELLMATQIDIWCYMTLRSGSGKNEVVERVMGIGDLKIGKWGHSIGHRYQLYAGQQMLLERHPEFKEHEHKMRLFNLTGKAFKTLEWNRKTFPYKFTDQTDRIDVHDFNLTVEKAKNHVESKLNRKFMYIRGEMGATDNPVDFITYKTLKDFVADGDWQRFLKTSASVPEQLLAS